MDWRHIKAVVIGAGMSGTAAAKLLQEKGALVYLMDAKEATDLPYTQDLVLPEEQRVFGREMTLANIPGKPPDLVVLSPGVPPQVKAIQEALSGAIRIWSEVELALDHATATVKSGTIGEGGPMEERDTSATIGTMVIGVTGSNGKTTTTSLIGTIAEKTGKRSVVAGNIGRALTSLSSDYEIITAELSSFQLAFVDKLRIPIAVLLNITPDHLDWHGSFEEYAAAKARIFQNQHETDLSVINWDCPVCRRLSEQVMGRRVYFSSRTLLHSGWGLEEGWIVRRCEGKSQRVAAVEALKLKGTHNWENVMAALAVGEELGLSDEQLAQVVTMFAPVQHRQENVGTFAGILYINDSKATNPDSAIKALTSYENPLVLLAGGRNKGLDMTEFMLTAKENCRSVILYGEAADELKSAATAAGVARVVEKASFGEAVNAAIAEACWGDVVLLSPGCTSWDAFKNYEERGACFIDLVRKHYNTDCG